MIVFNVKSINSAVQQLYFHGGPERYDVAIINSIFEGYDNQSSKFNEPSHHLMFQGSTMKQGWNWGEPLANIKNLSVRNRFLTLFTR